MNQILKVIWKNGKNIKKFIKMSKEELLKQAYILHQFFDCADLIKKIRQSGSDAEARTIVRNWLEDEH